MTVQAAYQQLQSSLEALYEKQEAAAIANLVIESVSGIRRMDRILFKEKELSATQEKTLNQFTLELMTHRPVQYVLNEAWFAGMAFQVNESVLIPRPETEELVEWVIEAYKPLSHQKSIKNAVRILDIGTGSGCIPISLQKKLPDCTVSAIDISKDALQLASRNADRMGVSVNFMQMNFLGRNNWPQLEIFDCIISNPPYIKSSERATMHQNVLDHEPSIALFVPDDDALIFYRMIAIFGQTHLEPEGKIFLEINQALGSETLNLFEAYGYRATLRKDMMGKDRMILAEKKLNEK